MVWGCGDVRRGVPGGRELGELMEQYCHLLLP